jgi:uncharacterized membrane protein YedE/YeeE
MMTTEFTPFASFLGGALLGLSAVALMLFSGRIAGIAGIIRRAIMSDPGSRPFEALAFIAGLLAASGVYTFITGAGVHQTVSSNIPLLVAAGFLVGLGSIIGSGCTSGHGVCGLSRFSARSIAATGAFMFAAFVTVYVMRHVAGG